MSKTATIASLLKANRPDLANHVAYARTTRKRKGSARDDRDFPPDLVFDTPVDAKLFWYRPGREDESAGLYVAYQDLEFWWNDIDANKAERVAEQVAEVLLEAQDDPNVDVRHELKRLGGR